MERTDWRYLSIDEVINLVQAKLRTRAGRLLLLGAIAISAVAIAVAPSMLRSNTPAPTASDAPIVKVTSPTTLPPATLPLHDPLPDSSRILGGPRIGPPLPPPTTVAPPPTTPKTDPPFVIPAGLPTALPTAPPDTQPPAPPPPPPTTPPVTDPPDTGVDVPFP